ncbi:hypothetical protein FIU97_07070 [Roseivivax sp. THAF40]|uniref:hypothetical protein n=1 Tax=unclassified Roseivivax TaxID=2639302 RepID=UPI00126899E6|nr:MULTISPECIES: hypothetical protein [unclassified Roseivivax]QFS82566.1 hypothetical protein FIV09_06970 [Roseivivax sp. THAF197b]QFT46335.1 hypothetical protein FIU97_07070 [Roseivivax sp. THAF40]
MTPDLVPRRRAVMIFYQRYLASDRAWQQAQRDARAWFPVGARPTGLLIGAPGSKLRKLYEQRDRALLQLQAAQRKFDEARQRRTLKITLLALPRV